MFQSLMSSLLVLGAGLVMQTASCSATFPVPDPGGGPTPPPDNIVVRFINGSPSLAVDVQFFASATVGDPAAVLFIPGNQRTAEIGFAGSGLIQPGQSDDIIIPCAGAQMIGIQGGRFLDVNTGALVGTGAQRVLSIGAQYNCGETITFTYTAGGGVFGSTIAVD